MAAGEIWLTTNNFLRYYDSSNVLRQFGPTIQGNYGGLVGELWIVTGNSISLSARGNTTYAARYIGTSAGTTGTVGEIYISGTRIYFVNSLGNVYYLAGTAI